MAKKFVVRTDAGPSVYLTRELDFVLSKVFVDDLSLMKITSKIPVNTSVPPGAGTIRWVSLTQVGSAIILRGPSDEIPRADFFRRENSSPIKTVWTSFGYTLDELENAEYAQIPLYTEGMNAAREAMARAINAIALFGDANNQLPGLLNSPNIPRFANPGPAWNVATNLEIIGDLNALYNRIQTQSGGRYAATDILLPLPQYQIAMAMTMFTGIELTVLEYFKRNHPGVTLDWVLELAGAGAGATDVAFGYVNSPDVLEYFMVLMFEPRPQQYNTIDGIYVPCREKTGGTIVYRPLACAYMEGI